MQRSRILIVDDESNFVRLLKLTLEGMGRFRVREENDGTRALEAVREFMPDLVLLDLIMPKMDGAEIARQIRADPVFGDTPILFLSGAVLKAGGSMQVAGFPALSKPIAVSELAAAIDAHLAAARASASSAAA